MCGLFFAIRKTGARMSTRTLFRALKAPVGNVYAKLVLVVLADISNEKDQCWPSHQYIADLAECSIRAVQLHLKRLETDGHITILKRFDTAGKSTSNLYTIHPIDRVQDMHPMGGRVQELQGEGAGAAHNTPIDTPIFINREKWAEWVDHLKAKRKTPPATTIAKQQKFLADYDKPAQGRIIDQSILHNWQGLFPLKETRNEPTRRGQTRGRESIEVIYVD